MIYLFDRAKKLQKIIPRKHIINATQTKVRNGIYQLAVEVPIFYEDKKGTQYNYQKSVSKSEFAGHFDDKNRFQLYKIYSRNITANEQGEFLLFDGVHIFFDEAKAMGNIHDRRFRDSEAKAPADAAFNSIGWTVIDYDVTDRHDINFYRASVTDAWNDLISTYGVEFDYELQFDGRKIISKNIIMKKQLGKWTGQRFAYGTNVLTLTQEQDESEVYTAAVGRGRGEEAGDGFGPRLEFGDIEWSKDGITKPVGQNYIELPSATAEYGFVEDGVVKPRIAPEVIFEDIEDKKLLADSTYQWLLENCLPKATWKTEVARIGNLSLGDTVGVLYKAAGIIKRARVERIEYNLLDPELSKLTLGDFHHFENRQMKRINAQIKRLGRDSNDRITRIKNEWNAWIDNQFTAAMNQFEQNLIDVHAEIEADRENMTNLIEGTRTEFTDDLNAEISQTKEYAEQQAQEKANAVRTDLGTVTSGHQALIDGLKDNVLDIDTFIGDKSQTLAQQFADVESDFSGLQADLLERINNIDTQSFNLIRGSRFDEPDRYTTSGGTVHDDEDMPYFRYGLGAASVQYLSIVDDIQFESGKTYTLSLDYRTSNDVSIDYLWIIPTDGSADINIRNNITESDMAGIIPDGEWHRTFLTFTVPRNLTGTLRMGSDFSTSVKGQTDIRLPYLTTSGNTQWVFHPSDSYESIISVMSRIDEFEQSVWAELEGVYGDLSSTRTELQKQLDDARSDLDSLEVGGRNLFREGNEEARVIELDARDVLVTSGYYMSSGIASGNPLIISHNLENGETYTLSGRLHAPNHPTVVGHNNIKILYEDGLVTIGKFPSNYEYHSITFKIDENRKFVNLHFDVGVYDAYIESKTLKLEKGNIATDWSPAPEDTEEKITTLNQQIEFIDGQLSAKLEQTDIEPINNKITEYGNTLTSNAQSIESLISKTELHDGDITQWSNLTTENAEGLEQTIGRVSTAEGKLSNAEFDIKANADSLKLTATKTEVENAIDGIEVGGRNIIPNSSNLLDWSKWSLNTTVIKMPRGMHRVSRVNPATGGAIGIHSKDGFVLKAGNEYTLSYKAYDFYDALPNYIYILSSEQGNTQLSNVDIKLLGRTGTLVNQSLYANQYKLTFTFTKDVKDGQILIGYNGGTTSKPNIGFYISDVQLEKGNKTTDWSPAPEDIRADITQLNTDINIEAGKIETLISKTELHDGDITQWSNETKANAESISQTLTRLEETEAGISQAQTDIQTNADGIAGVIRDVETIDGNLTSLTTDFNVEAGKVETLISKTDGHDTQLTNIVADYEKIEQTVAANDEWLGTYGSNVLQTVEGFEQKVWMSDIHNPNLIPFNKVQEPSNREEWNGTPSGTYLANGGGDFARLRNGSATSGYIAAYTPYFNLVEGERYTISFESAESNSYNTSGNMDYTFLTYPNEPNINISNNIFNTRESSGRHSGMTIYRYTYTFVASETTDRFRLLIGSRTITTGMDSSFYFRKPKIEVGNRVTPFYNAFSNLTHRADEIMLAVQGVGERGYLSQSDISVKSDYVQIGSQRLDGSDVGSILRVSPTGIDLVAEAMRLSGDLYVDGDITALAVDAIEGNFARLFANQLTADVITSEHIEVSTALIDEFFATSARIDELITKTHFVTEMHALTLNVVELNASEIRARLLTANTIEAEWLKGGTALIDRLFATTAMFERMMAKSGFVTTLNTVTIDTDQITIRRPDGGMLINNGVANWDFDVQMEEFIETTGVEWNGQWYETKRDTPTRVKIGSFKHSGTQLKLNIMIRLSGSSRAASELMFVTVRSFGGSLDYNVRRQYQVYRGSSQSHEFHVNLGVPEYEASMFYLEFQRDPSGTSSENIVQVRCNRAWQDG